MAMDSLMDQFTESDTELDSYMNEWEKDAELSSFMDDWEKDEKASLVQTADQLEERGQCDLQPTGAHKIMCLDTAGPNQSHPPVYAVLDVETTGLDRKKDRIIQIGVVKVENNVITPWMTYCNPGPCERIEEQTGAYQVHKISSEFLRGKPTFADVAPKLCRFLENVEYVVSYNCIFDWDLLMAEFNRLAGNEHSKALMKKIKWIDLFRLAIKSFPDLQNHKLATLLDKFAIRITKGESVLYLYKTYSTTKDRDEFEIHSLFEHGEKADWDEGHHDAVCDSLAAHTLLKKLLQKNGYSNIAELVDKFPQCVIDTDLFLALETKWKGKTVTDIDLKPFGARAEKFYCTVPQLRGKTLEELSVNIIEQARFFGVQEKDERVRLIYRAAVLNKKRKADSLDSGFSPKELKTE